MSLSPGGMQHDADARALVDLVSGLGQPQIWERGAEGGRAYLEERAAAGPPGPDLGLVLDLEVPGPPAVPVRLYRAAPDAGAGGRPVVVYLHGGGFVLGSVAASDGFCRRLAAAVDCVVVSVEYRLAPEDPFPAGLDDAVAAARWAADLAPEWGADPARLVLLGDSAGGGLAAAAAHRLVREEGPGLARLVLAYPVTSAADPQAPTPHGDRWPLTDSDMTWFREQYVPDPSRRDDPDASLLLADPAGLPRTTVVLGGCDPLFAEGMAYAQRLWEGGVEVDLHVYPGQVHGFVTFDPSLLRRSDEALGLVANAVRTA